MRVWSAAARYLLTNSFTKQQANMQTTIIEKKTSIFLFIWCKLYYVTSYQYRSEILLLYWNFKSCLTLSGSQVAFVEKVWIFYLSFRSKFFVLWILLFLVLVSLFTLTVRTFSSSPWIDKVIQTCHSAIIDNLGNKQLQTTKST